MDIHFSRCNIEARHSSHLGQAELVNYSWNNPVDSVGTNDFSILQLCLLPIPKSSRACFTEHWQKNRFENFGSLSLLPAGQVVHCKSDQRKQSSVFCGFDPQAIEEYAGQAVAWDDYPLERLLDINSPRLKYLLTQLHEELRAPGFGSDIMTELIMGQVVIELFRYLSGQLEKQSNGGLSSRNLQLIEQRVAEDPAPPSIGELARLCQLSTRHLSRAFRVNKGISIGAYIAEWRIRHAKLLLESGASIKSVAYSVGFSAPSNFTAAFQRETGKTPTQFLRQLGRI